MQDNNLKNISSIPTTVSDTATVSPPLTQSPASSFGDTAPQGVNIGEPAPFVPTSQQQTTPSISVVSSANNQSKTDSVLTPQTTTPLPPNDGSNNQVITSNHVPQKYGGGKVIATIFGVLLIAGAVVAGVTLVQQRQLLEQEAASGSECEQADDCVLVDSAGNTGAFDAPGTIKYVDITDQGSTRYYPGNTDDGCRRVNISGNHVSWEKYGPGPSCKDVSNVQIWHETGSQPTATPQPTLTPTAVNSPTVTPTKPPGVSSTATPSPKPSNTLTPTLPPGTSAQCSTVLAYDTEWNQLDAQSLSQLEAGNTIYLTVSGNASSGTFDKARFTINGVLQSETSDTKPGEANVFYDTYIIPAGMTTFTVGAQVHHSELDWF